MPRKSLVSEVADELRDEIVHGTFDVGSSLPSEAELGARFDVSRVTVREALRVLTVEGLLTVLAGKGSTVAPLEQWKSLNAILQYHDARGGSARVAEQLIAVRRMFETEAAALAAQHITDEDIHRLRECIERMRDGSSAADVPMFVDADLLFHDIIMRRSGNVFLTALFEPLTHTLAERRTETSRIPEIQENAIAEHENILAALEKRDADSSRFAMAQHMDQTLRDLRSYVLANPT